VSCKVYVYEALKLGERWYLLSLSQFCVEYILGTALIFCLSCRQIRRNYKDKVRFSLNYNALDSVSVITNENVPNKKG
jgi:hypothetical protein